MVSGRQRKALHHVFFLTSLDVSLVLLFSLSQLGFPLWRKRSETIQNGRVRIQQGKNNKIDMTHALTVASVSKLPQQKPCVLIGTSLCNVVFVVSAADVDLLEVQSSGCIFLSLLQGGFICALTREIENAFGMNLSACGIHEGDDDIRLVQRMKFPTLFSIMINE